MAAPIDASRLRPLERLRMIHDTALPTARAAARRWAVPVVRRAFVPLYCLPHPPGAQRGELVHDRIGAHVTHRGQQALAVHHIGHHRFRADAAQPLSVGLAAGDTDDLVASVDQLPGQRPTHGARGSGEQNSHRLIPSCGSR
jgi:hypothetical protein